MRLLSLPRAHIVMCSECMRVRVHTDRAGVRRAQVLTCLDGYAAASGTLAAVHPHPEARAALSGGSPKLRAHPARQQAPAWRACRWLQSNPDKWLVAAPEGWKAPEVALRSSTLVTVLCLIHK